MALALAVAGTVNIAMLLLAAASAPSGGRHHTIEGAHAAIAGALGPAVAAAFGVGLLARGLASTSVGTYAGATIMAGLLHVSVPLLVRRVVTLVPALVILGLGVDPTLALVLSQVALSLGIPFALVPLVVLTGRRSELGDFVNTVPLRIAAVVVTVLIVLLNVALLALTITG